MSARMGETHGYVRDATRDDGDEEVFLVECEVHPESLINVVEP